MNAESVGTDVGPGTSEAPRPGGHRAAVVGMPVAHSLSPVLHRAAYRSLGLTDWTYTKREVAPGELAPVLEELAAPGGDGPLWAGLSVTMPHKQALLPLLDVVDPLASVVGAVNTVVAQRSGRGRALLTGVNTDVAGIVGALREAAPAADGERTAVVLGSGATACSALAALTELGSARIVVVARRHGGPGRALTAAHRMGIEIETETWRPGDEASDRRVAEIVAEADLVVSTLPAHAADGPAVHLEAALGAAAGPRPGTALLDVVYRPWPTRLAGAWARAGGRVVPGWLMLLHQAVPQVFLMTGRTPSVDPMRSALEEALAEH